MSTRSVQKQLHHWFIIRLTLRGKEYRREIMCGHHMKKRVQRPLKLDQFPHFLHSEERRYLTANLKGDKNRQWQETQSSMETNTLLLDKQSNKYLSNSNRT